jgi:phosphomethylpyrimidine synthase
MRLKKAAEKGMITSEMKQAADHEGISAEKIRAGLASGTLVIPKNNRKTLQNIMAVGQGTRTKVNANIGASPHHSDLLEELSKLKAAVAVGADAVMDLSLGPLQLEIRREIIAQSEVMVGTVPIYQTAFEMAKNRRDITEMHIDDFLTTIRCQAEDGVDFMTIHAGVTRQTLETMQTQGRLLDVVSRGGALMVSWLRKNLKESPLLAHFDEILDILAEYDITLSLGDGMRPGATADATDRAQISELVLLGELTQRAWEKGVQVIIEGPGHVPLNQVAENIRLQKSLCNEAPFYVLGPLVTDIAAGYDHIAGAIGGAVAAMHGADFLCYVTPAEHLRLPSKEDVIEGVIASKIAAHAADVAKGLPTAIAKERTMAKARKALDWQTQISMALHSEKARKYRDSSAMGDQEVCSMCGEFCAIKRLQQHDKIS